MPDPSPYAPQPVAVAAPSRWPPRIAMGLGLICLIAGLACGVPASRAEDRREQATAEAGRAADEGRQEDQRALLIAIREARQEAADWRRRRLGLVLAGLVLIVGGFGASGLRALHEKMTWAERDPG